MSTLFNPIVLTYHGINTVNSTNSPWVITPDTFKAHLKILSKYRDLITLTFDDGRLGCWWYLPLMTDSGFKGVYYITTSFAEDSNLMPLSERYDPCMHWSHIEDIVKAGHTIGSHTCTHTRMDTLSDEQQVEELVDSRANIHSSLSHVLSPSHVTDFAAPYGALPNLHNVRSAGYATCATTVPERNYIDELPTHLSSVLVISRWQIRSDIYNDIDLFERDLNTLIEVGYLDGH